MSKKLNVSRRRFLQAGAGLAAASSLAIPRKAHAAPVERKFLFFFAGGGWDTTTVLDPHYNANGGPTGGVDMDPDSYKVSLFSDRLSFTGGPDRLGIERFFNRWGNRAAIVNGINAHSVGHDSARQFVMTGPSASSYSARSSPQPDWRSISGAAAMQ